MSELPDELRNMFEMDNQIIEVTKIIAGYYNNFIDAGLNNDMSVEFTKFIISKIMEHVKYDG